VKSMYLNIFLVCIFGLEVDLVFFIIRMKQLNTCSSNVDSLDLYGQSSK
jgi:hypothetical protein